MYDTKNPVIGGDLPPKIISIWKFMKISNKKKSVNIVFPKVSICLLILFFT